MSQNPDASLSHNGELHYPEIFYKAEDDIDGEEIIIGSPGESFFYFYGLDPKIRIGRIVKLFEQFGRVKYGLLTKRKSPTGVVHGFGVMTMSTREQGGAAVGVFDDTIIMGRRIYVGMKPPPALVPLTSDGASTSQGMIPLWGGQDGGYAGKLGTNEKYFTATVEPQPNVETDGGESESAVVKTEESETGANAEPPAGEDQLVTVKTEPEID